MIDPLLMGAASGVVSSEVQGKWKELKGEKGPGDFAAELKSAVQALHADLAIVSTYYRRMNEPPIDTMVQLNPDPQRTRLLTYGRHHNMVFCPNASPSPQMACNIPGIGVVTITLNTGWTALDFREGTELFLATGNPVQIIVRASHYPLGAGII